MNIAVEEHGAGKQLFRFRIRPFLAPWGIIIASLFGSIALLSALDGAWLTTVPTAMFGLWLLSMGLRDSGMAVAGAEKAVEKLGRALRADAK
jgi:hypothetical protein